MDKNLVTDFSGLHFVDSFVRNLPGDASGINVPRELRGVAYSLVNPTPVSNPRLLAWSDDLAATLSISRPKSEDNPAVQALAGNLIISGMRPYAARYGGHQFGHWAGQLGDGRAITLGEMVTDSGARFDLQLKGAGTTPYSRHADGRAVLRSSLREFLCSEAMHHLGIPTTRALSLVATGESVLRDMLYDGNAAYEPGAIVCRVSPSFVRFGNFEILAANAEHELLKKLLDYVIATHFPELGVPSPKTYALWFSEVCRRTALMIAHWMRVGFVHGVMNTDNLSVLGLTMDYGPYGWLEGFDPSWTPNTTDAAGRRYCFGNQAQIALWNLSRLAGALSPLIELDALESGLDEYRSQYERRYGEMFSGKLGLNDVQTEANASLLADLLDLLGKVETDYTIFFRRLGDVAFIENETSWLHTLSEAFYTVEGHAESHQELLLDWLRRYRQALNQQGISDLNRQQRMRVHNPKYVARNYLAQLAIDAAGQGDTGPLERLLKVLQRPYDEQPEHEDLAVRRPEWARHKVGCSALSCSS